MALILNMACGLANRMFQYSYYLWLKRRALNPKIDFFVHSKIEHENVDWFRIFPNAVFERASWLNVFIAGGGNSIFARFRRKFFRKTTVVKEQFSAFELYLPEPDENVYLLGVFQNANLAEDNEDEIKRVLKFAKFSDEYNIKMQKELTQCNSVGIHVRKGIDYIEGLWFKNTCTQEYYLKAIEYIREHVENPVFYVFTDNPDWVRKNFKGFDYTILDGNPTNGWGSHFDMQLMSLCKHNIICNSTYSWWGAFLNNNPDKIVILPNIWFNEEAARQKGCPFDSSKLRCKNWIAL